MGIDLGTVLNAIKAVSPGVPAFVSLVQAVSRGMSTTDQNQIKQALDEAMKRSDDLHATAQAELRRAE